MSTHCCFCAAEYTLRLAFGCSAPVCAAELGAAARALGRLEPTAGGSARGEAGEDDVGDAGAVGATGEGKGGTGTTRPRVRAVASRDTVVVPGSVGEAWRLVVGVGVSVETSKLDWRVCGAPAGPAEAEAAVLDEMDRAAGGAMAG